MRVSTHSGQAAGGKADSQLRFLKGYPRTPHQGWASRCSVIQALPPPAQGPVQLSSEQTLGSQMWAWTGGKLPEHAVTLRTWWWLQGGMGSLEARSFTQRSAGAMQGCWAQGARWHGPSEAQLGSRGLARTANQDLFLVSSSDIIQYFLWKSGSVFAETFLFASAKDSLCFLSTFVYLQRRS